MWNHIIDTVTETVPKINEYLLYEYRAQKIGLILQSVDEIFQETENVFRGEVKYNGYHICTPEERLEHLKEFKRGNVQIMQTTDILVRFEFEFEGVLRYSHVGIPFLYNKRVYCTGNEVYPIFAIIEKGCVNVIKHKITVSLMKNVLLFWRNPKHETAVITEAGKKLSAIILHCKIHNDSRKTVPSLIYVLAKYGFTHTMEKFGFGQSIYVVPTREMIADKGWDYIKLPNDYAIKYDVNILKGVHGPRLLVTLEQIFKQPVRHTIHELENVNYYRLVFGYMAFGKSTNLAQQLSKVQEHIGACDIMLDRPAKLQLQSINIDVDNIYDLIVDISKKTDSWIKNYNTVDLSKKKVASLELLLAQYTRSIFHKVLRMTSRSQKGIRGNAVGGFTSIASKSVGEYIYGNKMFVNSSDRANDNFLFTIGLKKIRSENNLEISTNKKGKSQPPKEVLVAHDSQLFVESVNMLPSSNPVISGEINPYLKIDQNGNIIKSKIDHLADDAFLIK